MTIRDVKTNPYNVINAFISNNREHIGLKNGEINIIKVSELPIVDRYSTGSSINKKGISEAFLYKDFIEKNDEDKEKKQISLEDIDKRLMTIDDFLK